VISLIKLFLAGNNSGIPELPGIVPPDLGPTPPPKAKAFLARKSYISDITGFTAGDGDHSLTFLTVYIGAPAVERYFTIV
jgi:hypothetical protein